MLISVIIPIYNQIESLSLILKAFNNQTDKDFEVVIADDGSNEVCRNKLQHLIDKCNYSVTHVYQEDLGFRAARVRNLAAMKSKGEYLVFLDGDCIPRKNFIAIHRKLSQHGFAVAGNRVLLSQKFTKYVIDEQKQIWDYSFLKWIVIFLCNGVNRLHPLITFPIFNKFRNIKKKWTKVRTCNFGVFRKDFFLVDGFDMEFEGWGFEDSDLAIRLINSGVLIKTGRFASCVFHLFHQENDRSHHDENYARLQERINSDIVTAKFGISKISDQYFDK